jgi:hypothetical protein
LRPQIAGSRRIEREAVTDWDERTEAGRAEADNSQEQVATNTARCQQEDGIDSPSGKKAALRGEKRGSRPQECFPAAFRQASRNRRENPCREETTATFPSKLLRYSRLWTVLSISREPTTPSAARGRAREDRCVREERGQGKRKERGKRGRGGRKGGCPR